MILLTFLVAGTITATINNHVFMGEMYCAPYIDAIETDPVRRRFYPHVVALHRCKGGTGAGSNLLCHPKNIDSLTVKVIVLDDNSPASVVMQNHTKCTRVCSGGPSECNQYQTWSQDTCQCQCYFPDKVDCGKNHIWDAKSCECRCSRGMQKCASGKFWDEKSCTCICDEFQSCSGYFDIDSCKCIHSVP